MQNEFDNDNDFDGNDDEIEYVSKSELKREMHKLQALGEKLTQLPKDQLSTIPLNSALENAITEMARIKKNEARRRQMQYIGKLMRKADFEAIEAAYDALREKHDAATRLLHTIEQWRDRLIDGDSNELEAFIDAFQTTEIQQLRQLIRAAQHEKARNKPLASARKLFRLLRDIIVPS